MPPIDLDAIRARLAAATPRPWTATYEDADRWTSITGQGYSIDGDLWVVCPEVATCEGELGPDADLIAHAPEDLAALVAEVERLRAGIEALRDEWRATAAVANGAAMDCDDEGRAKSFWREAGRINKCADDLDALLREVRDGALGE